MSSQSRGTRRPGAERTVAVAAPVEWRCGRRRHWPQDSEGWRLSIDLRRWSSTLLRL